MKLPAALITPVLVISSLTRAAHIHFTVDTVSGTPGDAILIRAGYLAGEGAFSIDGQGRLREGPDIAVLRLTDALPSGTFAGWWAGQPIILTSDYFYATGRLTGGNFMYEIVQVNSVSGPSAQIAWGQFQGSNFVAQGISGSATRIGRSYNAQIAQHNHAESCALSHTGLYDITLIAWDSNAIYADSTPATFRINTCYANCDNSSTPPVLNANDFQCFLNRFAAGDSYANCDGSTSVPVLTANDFQCFLNAFAAGCA